jgi:hypothetical protein
LLSQIFQKRGHPEFLICEVTAEQWNLVEPVLPGNVPRCRPPSKARRSSAGGDTSGKHSLLENP